jgi:hypothetical protein
MPDSEPQVEDPRKHRREIMLGFAIIWGVNLVHLVVGYAAINSVVGILLLMFYLPIQTTYGVILIVVARRNHLSERSKGMMTAVAVTSLLSSTCTYWFLSHWH